MTITEATQNGTARLTRPEWSWTNFIELYLTESGGKKYHGPWAKLRCLGIPEVTQLPLWELPNDDQWQEFEVPPEKLAYVDQYEPDWRVSLWQNAP